MSAKISPDAASLPAVTFRPHSHRKGSHVEAGSASGNAGGSGIGLLPVGAGAGLFSKLLQSLEQVVGAQAPVAASPASNAAARRVGCEQSRAEFGSVVHPVARRPAPARRDRARTADGREPTIEGTTTKFSE